MLNILYILEEIFIKQERKMSDNESRRADIISTVDNLIERIQNLRHVMLGVTVSAIVLAPIAIGISIYLITHPVFFIILEEQDEFGVFLGVLLGSVLIISAIWFYTGVRQYISLSNWKQRYGRYLRKKHDLDSEISSVYHLDEDQT